jgi:glycosyltransferase involved in cell wall biosynthesis
MDRERFEPTVITLGSRQEVAYDIEKIGIPVHAMNMRPGPRALVGAARLVRTLRRLKPDVLQGWMYHGNFAALFGKYAGFLRCPLLWNIRQSQDKNVPQKLFTTVMVRLSAALSFLPARILYNAQASARRHEALGYRAKKTAVLPNGFDAAVFRPCERRRAQVRAALGIADDEIVIGLIARYHPMKDHANFFSAAGRLAKHEPRTRFLLAGRNVDVSNPEIARMANGNGVEDRVLLLGERKDIPELTAALDIATCSSNSEGFSNVIGEAMCAGVPCVVTDVGDSAFLVGDSGIVVPARDSQALADGWQAMIELGPAGRRARGQAARRRIEQEFLLESVAKKYEELYRGVAQLPLSAEQVAQHS